VKLTGFLFENGKTTELLRIEMAMGKLKTANYWPFMNTQ